ncbi:AI-2E family transporter [Croceicoccus sediminis]|uniref:AI-2E family transporter n=1 Tax=Croceicoccus sediminis TaxID=2571150 RepID=UPI001F0EFDF7|nr:AI-2E family transporter [Croceicoccus sediminis]
MSVDETGRRADTRARGVYLAGRFNSGWFCMDRDRIERGGFLLFLAGITLATLYIAWPFLPPLFWALLAAIMFQPLNRRMLILLRGRKNYAALASLLIITVAVLVPAMVIGTMVIDQATGIYLALQGQEIDAGTIFDRVHDGLPTRMQVLLDNSGYGEFEMLRDKVTEIARDSVGLIATRALAIGGGALGFVLSFGVGLYVTYFLLRDGRAIGHAVRRALPMPPDVSRQVVDRFVAIIRATIKGSVVVGLVQGALGAITFWIAGLPAAVLFGMLMAIFSLLPALGPAIVWLPAAVYLLAIGDIWQGVLVIVSGVAVIGMADNVLRPILVGRDTGIPDWIILVSTLGGIAAFGVSGIVAGPLVAGLFLSGWAILHPAKDDEVTGPAPAI